MAKKRENNRAVIYARFSPRTRADECESCERQIEICRSYCEFYKLEVIGEHMDKALSGGCASNRPGCQAAVGEAIKYRASLVVFSLSRLARNLGDLIVISNELNNSGCGLCSTKEKIDTSTAQGDLFFKMIGLIDEFVRRSNGEYTSRIMLQHQLNGRRMSYKLPYGYAIDPDDPSRMIANEYERKVIERVKQLASEGYSLRKIVEKLEQDDYQPRKRKYGKCGTWNHVQIQRILQRLNDNLT